MDRFAAALRNVARELDVPPQARASILLEMAADLESAYEHHRRSGASEEDAVERAQLMVLGSPAVVRHLSRLHRTGWRGWSVGVAARLTTGADLLLICAGVVPVLLLAGAVAARTLSASPSPLIWPLLAVGVASVLLIAVESGRILGGGRGGSDGLPLLLGLAAVAPAVGLLAAALAGWGAARRLAGAVGEMELEVLVQVGVAGALLLAGLLLGLAALLSWFVLVNRLTRRAERDVEAVLGRRQPAAPAVDNVHPLIRRRRA
jgi:hypothetical protein